MEKYLEEMIEIMEVDSLNPADKLASFEVWDSLTTLSIIAMADEEFQVSLTNKEIFEAETVAGLYDLIMAKKND